VVTALHAALIRAIVVSAIAPAVVTFTAETVVTELDPPQTTTDTTVLLIAPAETTTAHAVATESVVTAVRPVVIAATHTVVDALLVIDLPLAKELPSPPTTSVIVAQSLFNNSPLVYAPKSSKHSLLKLVRSRRLRSSKTVSVVAAKVLDTWNSRKKSRFRRHLA
jgi:hypothetical protein